MSKSCLIISIVLLSLITGCVEESTDVEVRTIKPEETAEEIVESPNVMHNEEEVIEKDTVIRRVICIDPGHQLNEDYATEPIGPNSDIEKPRVSKGATGVRTKVSEYELNLEVALKLKAELEKKDYLVILTREKHDVNISNSERAEIANINSADIFIRIHADYRESEKFNGISILCPSEDNKYTLDIYDDSNRLATLMLDSLLKETGANNMGISYRDDISGFNWSQVPVVLIEMGFMSNPHEDELLNSEDYQDRLVTGMIKGIEAYFE